MEQLAASEGLLVVRGLKKAYGGSVALRSVDLDVESGSIHALLGENGAGKSTLIRIIAGTEKADAGEVIFDGKGVAFRNPREALRWGVSVVYQELSLFRDLTVTENVVGKGGKGALFHWSFERNRARRALDRLGPPGAVIEVDAVVGKLRLVEQQLVEIARAVEAGGRLLILDEPTSALGERDAGYLFSVVRELAEKGMAVIFVSHRLREVSELCDTVTVLRDGMSVMRGEKTSGLSAKSLSDAILGHDLAELIVGPEGGRRGGDSIGSKSDRDEVLRFAYRGQGSVIPEVVVRRGEIVGLAGLSGSGRSRLLRKLFGIEERDNLHMVLKGREYQPKGPVDAMRACVGYVGEDRRTMSLFHGLGIMETAVMPDRGLRPGRLVFGDRAYARGLLERFGVRGTTESKPSEMSGGNQQKVVLGRWLPLGVELLLLDEPTRGVDVGAKAEMHRLFRAMAEEQQLAIVIVSSEMDELAALCDRVVLMVDGRVVDEISVRGLDGEDIYAAVTALSGG